MLVNTPSSQGAIGDLYNFRLDPSLTLVCGSWGNNSVIKADEQTFYDKLELCLLVEFGS